jgi:hypothetical protein
MVKKYFYKLLSKYISFYLNVKDIIVEVRLFNNLLLKENINVNSYNIVNSPEEISELNPDFIIINSNLHYEQDVYKFLSDIYKNCKSNTRLIILYYSSFWKLFFNLANFLKIRNKTPEENWISHEDIDNLLLLTDFEKIRKESRILMPIYIPFISWFLNRFLSPLPFFRLFTLTNIVVARPKCIENLLSTVSIIIPASNEEGNIENIIKRIPKLSEKDELIFIEGNSKDNTWEKIKAESEKNKNQKEIIFAKQEGKGKGDAVRKGFSLATKDILMILDADLTVPPEDLVKFYKAIITNKGEFINGSRLVYPLEKQSMRFLNLLGNKFFALSFSYLTGQRFKDTLCGTKVISRKNYLKIAENRSYFGNFDPFGDFDLIFGATKLGLKIVEIPVRYKERVYGRSNIQRWKHGMVLLKMLYFGLRKIKFI